MFKSRAAPFCRRPWPMAHSTLICAGVRPVQEHAGARVQGSLLYPGREEAPASCAARDGGEKPDAGWVRR